MLDFHFVKRFPGCLLFSALPGQVEENQQKVELSSATVLPSAGEARKQPIQTLVWHVEPTNGLAALLLCHAPFDAL